MLQEEVQVEWIDRNVLTPVVRKALDDPSFQVESWQVQPVHSGAGGGLGIFRVSGDGFHSQGQGQGGEEPGSWSVVLKVLGITPETGPEPDSFGYWRREAHVYESGFVTQLPPGLCTPYLLGVQECPGSITHLWMEDLSFRKLEGDPWPLEYYGRAAHHFGVLNGLYTCERPLPQEAWWSRGWLRKWVELSAPAVDAMRGLLGDPVAKRVFPPPVDRFVFELFDARHAIYAFLDRMPQTLCHMDAFSRNLFMEQIPGGGERVVALDWSFAGHGALGEEIVPLAVASHLFTPQAHIQLTDLCGVVMEGYLAGLREAGWQGDPHQVELVYQLVAPLRYMVAIMRHFLLSIQQPEVRPVFEMIFSRPFDQLLDQSRELHITLTEMGRQALERLPQGS